MRFQSASANHGDLFRQLLQRISILAHYAIGNLYLFGELGIISRQFDPILRLNKVFLLVTPVASTQKKLNEISIRGYITEFHSPTSFEIEDYRITRDVSVVLEFEKSPDVSFKIEDLRVGTLVEICGLYNEEANELKATQMKVDLEQFRQLDVTISKTKVAAGGISNFGFRKQGSRGFTRMNADKKKSSWADVHTGPALRCNAKFGL